MRKTGQLRICLYRYLLTNSFNSVIMNTAAKNKISALSSHIRNTHVTSSNVANV